MTPSPPPQPFVLSLPVRNAARMAFFVCGFATAAWAPLVPYAKSRLLLDEAALGALLLCLGAGSLATMSITAPLAARFGCRGLIVASTLGICAALPPLAAAPTSGWLAASLLFFGASLGVLDVAINIHAAQMQRLGGKIMMSGLHALYSVGGFLGAGGVGLLLSRGLVPVGAAFSVAGVVLALLFRWGGHLLKESSPARPALFALPRGRVLFLCLLAFIMYLAEGAMLDWSAVFLSSRGMAMDEAGWGYGAFAVAMTIGRFTGDGIVRGAGRSLVLRGGSLCVAAGFALAAFFPFPAAAMTGFALIGLGAANIVPVIFTEAGNQTAMPAHLAVGAISLFGYGGILIGPAFIGFLARATSLDASFAVLAVLTLAPAAASGFLFSGKK
ncbi:MAG: MFS transporter [Planctomycetota bacterium]|jgi:predicted MFS family arabinose efflux permease|nr:MFS transporter [Planctomycetota bacterium]